MESAIISHLRRIVDLNIPVFAIYNKGRNKCSDCRLIFNEDFSLVCKSADDLPTIDTYLGVSYSLNNYSYTFQCQVAGVSRDSEDLVMSLRLPIRVARIERRKSPRVKCPTEDPVAVTMTIRGRQVDARAFDISKSGVGVLLYGALSLAVETIVTLEINLPLIGRVKTEGKVVFSRTSGGRTRLGIEFENILEDEENDIGQYVHLQIMKQKHKGTAKKTSQGNIFVVKQVFGYDVRLFVCSDSPLDDINDFAAFSEIACVSVADFIK